jgi:hypothetical protein
MVNALIETVFQDGHHYRYYGDKLTGVQHNVLKPLSHVLAVPEKIKKTHQLMLKALE